MSSTSRLASCDQLSDQVQINKVPLREQVFHVLRMLLEREGQIVTREEIKHRLWANDTVVDFDRSINATIKALRRTLGDSADRPRYIETLARRGYRLIVPIECLESLPAPAFAKPCEESGAGTKENETGGRFQANTIIGSVVTVKPRSKAALVLASAAIWVVATYISWRHFRPTRPTTSGKIRLAALPFQNLRGDPKKDYLADGLTEGTISLLGRLNPERAEPLLTNLRGDAHYAAFLKRLNLPN